MGPLYEASSGNVSQHKQITWTNDMDTAFQDTKNALANATLLAFPKRGAHISLTVDASDTAIGGVLEQLSGDYRQPLAFFSKML